MKSVSSRSLPHVRVLTLTLLGLTLVASAASAQSSPSGETVLLLQPTDASLATRRSLIRIRDELAADRFRAILVESAESPPALLENAGNIHDGENTLALFGDPATGQTELWLVRRAHGRIAVRQVNVVVTDPERMPSALSAQALQLLRATALELSIATHERVQPPAPPPAVSGAAAPAVDATAQAPQSNRLSVDMGVGVWTSIDGPPAAVTPSLRVGLYLSRAIQGRLSLAGLGTRPRLDGASGSATISQNLALLEITAGPERVGRLRPNVSLGAGVLNVTVSGTGATPYEGRGSQAWAVALDGGVGLAFDVGPRVAFVAEAHAMLATPHPTVRFVDTRAATIGYPSLLLTLALQVSP